jgi:1-acyl-sn-glycerol-3-phosphate acyltransferase
MGVVLAPLRALLVTLHFIAGLVTALCVFPLVRQHTRNHIISVWSRWLVALCGVQLTVDGEPIPPEVRTSGIDRSGTGRLVVANHVSWLDSFAIHAVMPCRFIAKAEIGNWPLLGLLVTRSGMLYIERGRRHAVASINHQVREHLLQGEAVAVYPEGTTNDGTKLLRFHSNLLAPAIETGAPVWPFAIRYTQRGAQAPAVLFVDDTGFYASLLRILAARGLAVRITRLPAIDGTLHENRHAIARAAHAAIAEQLRLHAAAPGGERTNPPAAPAPADNPPETVPDR